MKLTLGVEEKKTVTVGGGRFYYESGLGRIRVKTIGSAPGEFDLSPGMGFQNRADMDNFFAVEVENISGFDQTIEFIISYREVFDNRVTFGAGGGAVPVDSFGSVIEQTERGFSFLRSRMSGAGTGLNACVSLRNPYGSSRHCFIKKVDWSFSGDSRVFMYLAGNLSLLEVNPGVSNLNAGGDESLGKKLVGGGLLAGGSSAVSTGSFNIQGVHISGLNNYYGAYCKANEINSLVFSEPVRIPPGMGFVVVAGASGVNMSASFEVVEKPV